MRGKINNTFSRGYGFITPDGSTEKRGIFFCKNDCEEGIIFDSLNTGDELEFELSTNEKGKIAKKVRLIKSEEPQA